MGEVKFARTLIVGGTGMLAKASAHVASISRTSVLAARNPLRLATKIGAMPLKLDWTKQEAREILCAQPANFDLMISWVHGDGFWLIEHLENLLVKGGRSIRVLGSNALSRSKVVYQQPDFVSDIIRQIVILGWVNATHGRRWLSDAEISDAVILAVQNQELATSIAGTHEN